jgi:hypothetical protein
MALGIVKALFVVSVVEIGLEADALRVSFKGELTAAQEGTL